MAILKRALIVLFVLLMIPVVLLAGLFVFARTETGLSTIASLAETYGSTADSKIAIGGIEGTFPSDLTVRNLALADRDGVWLTIDRARLAWSPLALLSRKVEVEALELGRVDVARAPNLPESTEPEPVSDPDAPLIPDLPVEIDLKRLAVDDLNLGEPVLGAPARLAADMAMSLRDPREGVNARFDVRRTDGIAGRITGSASFAPQTERFQISVRGGEPAGGLIARLADMPGQPPIDIGIEGGGTLDALRVQAALTAGDRGRLDAAVQLDGETGGRRVKLALQGDVGRIVPPAYAALVDGPTTANVDAFVPDEGPVRISDAVVELPAARLSAKGEVDLGAETLAVSYDLKARDGARFASLLPPGIAWSAISAEGSANGPFTHPHIVATIDGTALNAPQGGAATARITLDAAPNGPLTDDATRIAAKGSIDAKSVTFAGDGFLAAANRDLTAAFDLVTTVAGVAEVAKADVALGDIKASYIGAVSADMAKGKATVAAPDLSPLSALAGRPLTGSVNLAADVDVAFDLSRLALSANGRGEGLTLGIAQLDALTGGDLAVVGGVTRAPNGAFAFDGLKVTGKHVALEANGSATLEDADVSFRAAVDDLNVVEPRAAGRATLDGKLTGRLDDLALTAKLAVPDGRAMNRSIKDLAVDVTASDVTGALGGVVRLGGSLDGKPVRGQARLVTEADGARRLEDVDLDVATANLKGGVSVTPAGLATGRLTIAAPDLAEVGALALTELGGQLSADVALSVEDGVQKVLVTANGADIAAPGARVGQIDVAATVLDPTGKITVDGVVNGSGIAAGGQVVDRLAIKAQGAPDGMDVTADVTALGAAASAAGRVVYAPTETRIDLSKLDLNGGGQAASLASPARVRLVGSDVFIDAFSLKAGQGGALDLSGRAGQTLDLSLAIRDLPLALANAVAPDLDVRGALGATARVTGPATAPVADFDVTLRDLSMAQIRAADVGPLMVATKGRYVGDSVTTDTTVTGPGGLRLTAVGSAPIAAGDLDMDVAIRALPLKLANGFVDGFGLAGELNGEAKVTGPIAAPRGTYAAKIDGFTSTRAQGAPPVTIEAKGELQGLRVTTDTLITGGGGVRATAKGSAPLGAGPLDLDVAIAELPLALANAFAPDLGLGGSLQGGAKITGPISAPQGGYDFRIRGLTAAQAAGVPPLEVTTKGELQGARVTTDTLITGGGGVRATAKGSAPLGDGPLDLDVAIAELPLSLANAFAPDLGLAGTLQGTARVTGPVSAPLGSYAAKIDDFRSTRAPGAPAITIETRGELQGVRVTTDTLITGGGGLRATAKGSAPLGDGPLDLNVAIAELPLALANAVAPDLGLGGRLQGAATVTGPMSAPRGGYDFRITGLTAAQAQGVPPLEVTAKGELQGSRVTTDTLITGGGGVRATAKGSAPIGDGPLDIDVAIAELPLALANAFAPDLGLDGALTGDARVTGPVAAPGGRYDFRITGLNAALVKGAPALQVTTKGELQGGRVTTDTTVTGPGNLRLTAVGSAPMAAGDLDMDVAIRALPLKLADGFVEGFGLAGELNGDAKITGPIAAPRGSYAAKIDGFTSSRAKGVPAVAIETKGELQGVRVTTDTLITGGGGVRATVKGSAPLGAGPLDIDVAIAELPLALANAFAPDLGLGGRLQGGARVTGPISAPRGGYDFKVTGLTAAQAKGVPALQVTTKGELEGSRVTTNTEITGGGVRATAKGFAPLGVGPLDVDVAIAELPLSLANAFAPELGLAGRLQGGARVTGSVAAPRGGYDFKITGLTAAQAKGVPALQVTTKGELAGSRVTTNTEVTGGGGLRLTARGAIPVGAGDVDMAVELRSVPLALANGFSPGLGAQGTLQGDAKVAGSISAPRGTYTAKISNLSTAQTRGAGVPVAQIDSKGRLEGMRVVTETVVTGAGGLRVTASGAAPLGQGGLDLRVVGRAPLAFLNDTLSVSGDRISGAASFDVKVGGTTAAPAINGTARLENASYSNRASGLQLRGIQAVVAGNGTNVEVRSLRATTRNGGTISGSGRVAIDPGRGFPGEIRIQAQNAEVVGTDIVTAVIDSNLTLQGPLARRPVVSGTIRARSVEIQIPDRLPAQYTPLEGVKHRGAPPRVTAQLKAVNAGRKTARSEDGFLATLDIDVQANDRIFIRGMGITSEAGGSIKLAGTSANPQPVGAFELRSGRGQIVVIGQRLTFTRGSVSFAGDLDPTLDFLAETKARDITAQVLVTGTASRPQINFTSQPTLPTDEVLARLLFKKSAGELNASEALQLAQGLAQYTGGAGSGALDSVRKSLGVDVLDVTAGDGQGGGPAVGVGRYISDNIYLGVRQGTSPESSRITVDIDVTKNVKVQGETGAGGDASAGVAVEWDY